MASDVPPGAKFIILKIVLKLGFIAKMNSFTRKTETFFVFGSA